MTTIDIEPKIHKKLKKEAVKRNMDLKDVVAEKLGGIVIMVLLFTGGLGLALGTGAYGEEVTVNIPFENWNADFCTFMGFPLENGTTLYKYECIWTGWLHQIEGEWVPVEPTDSTIIGLPDAPEAYLIHPPEDRQEPVIEEPVELTPDEKRRAEVDERRAELDEEKLKLLGDLAECRTGLGAFAAYQEQEAIEDYTNQTRWQFEERDNLSSAGSVLTILKAIEECDIMKEYVRLHLISEYELNKYLADIAGTDYLGRTAEHPLNPDVTDQSDSMVETDPVTPKDIAEEVDEMEALKQRLIDERKFEDPDAPLTGINRGFQPTGLNCSVFGQPAPVGSYPAEVCPLSMYDAHILKNWDSITYSDIRQLQCDNFLYIYQHLIGDSERFPGWLKHCVPKVVFE